MEAIVESARRGLELLSAELPCGAGKTRVQAEVLRPVAQAQRRLHNTDRQRARACYAQLKDVHLSG